MRLSMEFKSGQMSTTTKLFRSNNIDQTSPSSDKSSTAPSSLVHIFSKAA